MREVVSEERAWSWPRRFALAAGFTFVLLANLPAPFHLLPYGALPFRWLERLWNAVVPVAAAHVFHAHATLPDYSWNTSVDSTFHFVQYALWIAISLAVGAVVSSVARNPARYDTALRLFHLYVRYTLALAMIKYGAAKATRTQFPPPLLDQLVTPAGALSPMALGWLFVGYSAGTQMLIGITEMLGGILLTIRRTTLLGALLSAPMLASVTIFNFCYGVPVKTYVSLLLLMSGIIICSHGRRLIDFFIRNRTAEPKPIEPLFRDRKLDRAAVIVRTLVVLGIAITSVRAGYLFRVRKADLAPKSPLRGIWNVDVLEENGAVRPPLTTDLHRWRRLVFDDVRFMSIQEMSDARRSYFVKLDERTRTASMVGRTEPQYRVTLHYERPAFDTLAFDAVTEDGRRLRGVCHRADDARLRLTSSPFRWIVESPNFE